MRLDRSFRPRSISIVLVLVLSILGLAVASIPIGHSAGPIIFKAKADNPNGFSPLTIGPLTVALGDALIVTVFWYGTGGAGTVTDSQGNVFGASPAIQSNSGQSSGANTAIWDAIASAAGSDTVTV